MAPGDDTPWSCSGLPDVQICSAARARRLFHLPMGTLVLASSSDSGILRRRFSPARPRWVPRRQPPPREKRRAQAGKEMQPWERRCFSWWELSKTITLEGLSALGQLQQSTKHQAGESLEREMVRSSSPSTRVLSAV